MKFDPELLNEAITMLILKRLEKRGIVKGGFAPFAREVGLTGTDSIKTFRLLRNDARQWSLANICKIAKYFDENPSIILARAEHIYMTRLDEVRESLKERKSPENKINSPQESTKKAELA